MKTSLSTPKKSAFYVITALIPVLILLVLEGGLRLVGFGKDTPLFIVNPSHSDYLLGRPDVMSRYFPYSQNKPAVTLETDFFLAQKPANGLRVFVQGGSTAAGFPYGLGASLAGMLEYRLQQSLPNRHVEVVNTAMSAVNSHTLLDFSDEIIEQQPDLIIIYAGHNEFLGVLGSSSNFATSDNYLLTRAMLNVKHWRLFQAIQWLYASFQTTAIIADTQNHDTGTGAGQSMMAKVAVKQSIALNSPSFEAGVRQFEANMDKLLAKYKEAGIPVFISNIASNHKDQAPLKSTAISDDKRNLLSAFNKGSGIVNEDFTKASQSIEEEDSADLHFAFANLALQNKRNVIAKKHFELAVQHDLLKFRAPAIINDIIKMLAERHDALYVDTLARLQARSTTNIVGNESMLEHLHPNLQAYFVISDAVYQAIENSALFNHWLSLPAQLAWQQRLVLPSEEYNGFAIIQKLKSDYPFVAKAQKIELPAPNNYPLELGLMHFQKQIDWLTMMTKNLDYYQKINDKIMATKTLQILADAIPSNGLYNIQAAQALDGQNRASLALYYYKTAVRAGLVDSKVEQRIVEIIAKHKMESTQR